MDFKKHISEIEKKIKYIFKDKSLLTQAFTRASYCNEKNYGGRADYMSNEVLEFFGDSVLSTAIISILLEDKTERYEHGIKTELKEGDFSNIRSKLSDKRNLSLSMAGLGLQRHLIMGEGDAKLGIENEPSVMEDLFESIIGAVYIDCGMDIERVIEVVRGMLDISVYLTADAPLQSAKNALQEWCADKKRRLPAPVYRTISESGPDHKKVYERGCYVGDRLCGTAKAKNQKLADTAAAEAALNMLKAEEKPKDEPIAAEVLTKLKTYAMSQKLATPEYRDLGESPRSTVNEREYIIECRFAGKSASGIGRSKQEARAKAAEKILSEIKSEKSVAKHPERKKKAITKEEARANLPIAKELPKDTKASHRATKPKRVPHWRKKRS